MGGLGDCLGAGIDGGYAFDVLEALGEERYQSPADGDEFALVGVAVIADDGLDGRGRDVVIPRRRGSAVADELRMEGVGDFLLVALSVVAAAHVEKLAESLLLQQFLDSLYRFLPANMLLDCLAFEGLDYGFGGVLGLQIALETAQRGADKPARFLPKPAAPGVGSQ